MPDSRTGKACGVNGYLFQNNLGLLSLWLGLTPLTSTLHTLRDVALLPPSSPTWKLKVLPCGSVLARCSRPDVRPFPALKLSHLYLHLYHMTL
ncbi:hypothetical protein GDO78_017481 [Eleutherodactylus coqui]|uniref:Uncharacterized protein n=1 Tax=Eleutherodactylus coqui TaxID=57060 RepID=A0A8J6BMT2_ELECQ|nr:hypothetical protein GDO78_017481 [Eleutherodactylus coqui]